MNDGAPEIKTAEMMKGFVILKQMELRKKHA